MCHPKPAMYSFGVLAVIKIECRAVLPPVRYTYVGRRYVAQEVETVAT